MARISNERHSHISVYTHVFFFCLCSCCFFASPSVFGSVFCNPFFPYGVRPTQYLPQPAIKYFSCHKTKSTQRRRRKKEEGRLEGRERKKQYIQQRGHVKHSHRKVVILFGKKWWRVSWGTCMEISLVYIAFVIAVCLLLLLHFNHVFWIT